MTEAPIDHAQPDLGDRIAFLFPGFSGEVAPLEDEATRLDLIVAEHGDQTGLEPEQQRLHTSLHLIVANQVLGHNPPSVWPTLQRIVAKGYTRHDALHMVAAGMSDVVLNAMKGRPQPPEVYLRYLAGLPAQAVRHRPAPTSRTGGSGAARGSGRKRR